MGCTQDELATHALEGSLLGDIVQHHHGTEDRPLGVADRGQAVGQQAAFLVHFQVQVVRWPVQAAAAQHLAQLLFQFGALQGFGQAHAQAAGVPAELALGHGVEVLQAALAVDDQQAVVDAVEHRLQALLAGEQFVDVGGLVLAQGVGHQAEAAGQLVQLGGLGDRQGDVEIALANLVGGLGQCLDWLAEAARDVVRGDKAQHQHCQAHQAQQATDQQGVVAGFLFAADDVFQCLPMGVEQVGANLVEGCSQWLLDAHAARGGRAFTVSLDECLVVAGSLAEAGTLTTLLQALVEQRLELVLQGDQVVRVGVLVEHQVQLLAQVLPQPQAQVQRVGGVLDQALLLGGHLHHADQAQQ